MSRLGDYLSNTPLDRLDADILCAHALGVERSYLYSHPERDLGAAERGRIDRLFRARVRGVPLAYLTGHQEFWSLDLQVDPRVLVPRPETELLVEVALERTAQDARVLELGTGSGAVALALKHECPHLGVTATDSDRDALAVARANAAHFDLDVDFIECHWYGAVRGCFDAIVCNPPYVASDDPHLADLTHEPLTALDGGADGLDDLRVVIGEAPEHLEPGGWLLVEHGWDQAEAVRDLFAHATLGDVETRRDLAGHDRVTVGRLR